MKGAILIVDDEKTIRFTLSSFLADEGIEVKTAESYEAALAAMADTCFDVIFADIILGGRTGIDLLREVKRQGLPSLLVVITGKPDIDTAAESVRLGAFDYIPKPVRKDTLLRVADAALQHRAREENRARTEAERELSRQQLESTFNSIKDGIVTVDTDLRILEANEAVGSICGFTSEELTGTVFDELPCRCEQACLKAVQETVASRKTIKQFSLACGHHEHPLQVVNITSSPLVDQSGMFKGAALVISDATCIADLAREGAERTEFYNIIGKSPVMQNLYRLLEYLADTETTVLITGESGTGKELVARALHKSGIRSAKPFVAVNCSALSETLLESELFGHVKGAFTGALKDVQGRFEVASGGTILLDEIGDIAPRIQLKLLRVLQEKEFERVGDPVYRKVDVRIIASTNRDLRERVQARDFREDLYYRLKVVEVKIPPLRERREDITLLAGHFFNLFSKKMKKQVQAISEGAMEILVRYQWPGNVRELEHAMEHAFILCQGPAILPEHLPSEIRDRTNSGHRAHATSPDGDLRTVLNALQKTDWNKAKAARLLGISRPTLYGFIKKYNLSKDTK